MPFTSAPVRVTVPATSANLGPGFDALGLALDLRDRLEAQVVGDGLDIRVDGAGSDTVPRDADHLVVRAMRLGFEALGHDLPGLRLSCHNVIPHARGLGSSSAAIVGGLALARGLVEGGREQMDDDRLVALAAALEGHPDNVAPACLGGFVVAGRDEPAGDTAGGFYAVPSPVRDDVSAVVLVPPDGVETEVARGLLPDEVAHADAATNAGRAALLVTALAHRPDQLLRATHDLLHQRFRRPAMPASLALVDELRSDGLAALVSGAGPTVLVLTVAGESRATDVLARCPAGWWATELAVDRRGVETDVGPAA